MLSSGYPEYVDTPTLVMSDVKQIDYGGSGMLVLKTDSTLWSWGYADLGIVGNGKSYTGTDLGLFDIYTRINNGNGLICQPTEIMDHVKRLFSGMGGLHFAEKKDGSIWYWGYSTLYQIGDAIDPIGLKGTGKIETLYYIIPTPIEFSVDTFYQTALEHAQNQTITEG